MKARLNDMDKLTESILNADFARKKIAVYNKKAYSLYYFLSTSLLTAYLFYRFMSRRNPYLGTSSESDYGGIALMIKSKWSRNYYSYRQMVSPDLYYKEKALLNRNLVEGLNDYFKSNNNNYKAYMWG